MEKEAILEREKIVRETVGEHSVRELKNEVSSLSRELEKCQIKFVRLNQQEEVHRKQEMFLKKRAHDLNETLIAEQMTLDNVRRQAEKHVEDFICRINCALEKNKHTFETNGEEIAEKRKRRQEIEKRRKRYFQLKGELGALLLYKEYQECVISEIERAESNNAAQE
jgi:hypothetical protein